MKILLLILTLSPGAVEIRSEGAFDTPTECMERLLVRVHNADFRRGDVAGSCVQQDQMEAAIRALFGGRA